MNSSEYLPTIYQQFIYKSRYSRWLEEQGRREYLPETVCRYFDFFEEQLQDKYGYKVSTEQRTWLENKALNLHAMPSMRAIMTAGPALRRENMAGFNCSYLPVDDQRAFDEILYILMNGTGVGFSVEQKYIQKLPIIPDTIHKSETVVVVADSKIGWASGFRELIALLYAGKEPNWDLSKVRPAGARLATFGGRASGPEPLHDLYSFVVDVFKRASGRKLTSLECHDIVCKVAEIVVVGGVRRSALVSLGDLNDDLLRRAKIGQWWIENPQRALANNSWVAVEKPTMDTFFSEWYSLYESKSGERGIFNRYGALKHLEKIGKREPHQGLGSNPCVTGDTMLLTREGYYPISQCTGRELEIWNGFGWSKVEPFSTGTNNIMKVSLSDGTELRCTPHHTFVLAGDVRVCADELKPGDRLEKFAMPLVEDGKEYDIDAYSQGFYTGDGTENLKHSNLYWTKYCCKERLIGEFKDQTTDDRITWKHGSMFPKYFVPINGSLSFRLNWLAGLCDSDGTVTRDENGNGIQITSINKDFLHKVKLMLSRTGVRAKVIDCSMDAGYRTLPDGKGGSAQYWCQKGWRLLIGNQDTYQLKQLGFKTERLKLHSNPPQRDARRFIQVLSTVSLGVKRKTYCVTEPNNNTMTVEGVVTGNCMEILLRPLQVCNLSEVVLRKGDTKEQILDKIKAATIFGTWQSTLDNFRFIRKKWSDNQQEERLLGVSLTGFYDWNGDLSILSELKEFATKVNREVAEQIGISPSLGITCIKPSGTVSQLTDASSGLHPRHSPYYIRTVRGDKKDPLTQFLIDRGVPCENDLLQPQSTVVFSFPIKSPEGSICRNDITAIDQLEMYKKLQDEYCEHKPSITVNVKEHEWLDVGAWVYKNIDDVIGVSFLPDTEHSYKQAPYQDCSKEEYEELQSKMPKEINWDELQNYEKEDNTVGSQEYACSSGFCEIV